MAADTSPEGWVRGAVFELAASPWHQLDLRHGRRAAARPADRQGLTLDDRILLKALLQLSPARRRALVLHDVVGLDWKQTSTELESTTPIAYARVARARQELAEAVPTIVGGDAEVPGFGRRLGALLQAAADRACPAAPFTGQAEQAQRLRHRSALREWGVAAGAGLLSAVTAGGLAAALIWGTPMHPADARVRDLRQRPHQAARADTGADAGDVPTPTASPAPSAASGAAVSGAASGAAAADPSPSRRSPAPAGTPAGRDPRLTARVPGAPADGVPAGRATARSSRCPAGRTSPGPERPLPHSLGARDGAAGPARGPECSTSCVRPGSGDVPAERLTARLDQPMSSRARRAVSDGVLPTLTPAASRASFFACAVPEDPDTIAPAWPMVLPSGAVKPAT